MDLLAKSIFAREALFAYLILALRLVEIYVPFDLSRQSRNQKSLRKRVPHGAMGEVSQASPLLRRNAMHSFLTKFAGIVRGALCGLDRLFLRGTLRGIAYTQGLKSFLWHNRILYKDFGDYSQQVTAQLVEASLRQAQQLGREIRYLNSTQFRKEDIAREIAARDHIKKGPICVLRSVDPCMSFQIVKNHLTRKLEIRYRPRKCLHLYHYQIHPVFGFMHARIQTWFPFHVYICINGREWLARQMDQVKLRYVRRDNTFTWLQDTAQAQALLDQQLQANWPSLLDQLAADLNPAHGDIFAKVPLRYHWSVAESEWASDVMFTSRAALEKVYPQLVRYAITTFGTADVLRFFGQPVSCSGKVPHRCRHEVSTNVKERVEGVRLKHWFNNNNEKMYDKGSVLRPECTLREPGNFKVYRPAEGDPEGPKTWRVLRKGIVDLQHRAEISQAVNERYLEALAAVHVTTPLRELAEPLCRPTVAPAWQQTPTLPAAALEATAAGAGASAVATVPADSADGRLAAPDGVPSASPVADVPAERRRRAGRPRRVRALNPLAPEDAGMLEVVSRHEFLINGMRNRDVRWLLFGEDPTTPSEHRKRSAAVTRKLRLLRAHGLLHKVPNTHRYLVSEEGRKVITALLAARNASTEQLISKAG